jgi:hypothetical protein
MRRKLLWVAITIGALAIVLAVVGVAAPKSYQFTGTVKTVTGTTFTVQKSPTEIWDFSTEATTKGAPKVGDKVTVYYKMIATDIEVKPVNPPKK